MLYRRTAHASAGGVLTRIVDLALRKVEALTDAADLLMLFG